MDNRIFRARIEESSPGVWRASYRGVTNRTEPRTEVGGEGDFVLTDQHIATDRESAIAFVESLARNQGYERVAWEEGAL